MAASLNRSMVRVKVDFLGFCSIGYNLHAIWTNLIKMKVKSLIKLTKRQFSFSEQDIKALFRDFDQEVLKIVKIGLKMNRQEFARRNRRNC
jgi:ABC-type uncharacterized transport system involved in gliding motility auxiliary subunit